MLKEKPDCTKRCVKTIAVTSGKGGVGKTNVVVNLAIALKELGKEVMIVDGNLGLSNIDILLHMAPPHNIEHMLRGTMTLRDVVVEGPHGVKILPAGRGVQELTALNESQRLRIMEEVDAYDQQVDVLLIDTAAGITEDAAFFCTAAQEIVVVTSPEPTATADTCALIEVLYTRHQEKEFHVLVNSVRRPEEGIEVFRQLSRAAEKLVHISLDYLGCLPYDESVRTAVREQKAFIDAYPDSPASRRIREIALKIFDQNARVKGTLQFFIKNLLLASTRS